MPYTFYESRAPLTPLHLVARLASAEKVLVGLWSWCSEQLFCSLMLRV